MNYNKRLIEFYSIQPIAAHQEIAINYNGTPDGTCLDWFRLRGIPYHD